MALDRKNNKISVSIGITKNLQNYESLRLDATVTEEVNDVDDPEAWAKLWKLVDDQLEAQLQTQYGGE